MPIRVCRKQTLIVNKRLIISHTESRSCAVLRLTKSLSSPQAALHG
ncbi:hypothetical protein HMPREF0201_04465 [Cedecea davisae DSM 4568]|uniref:Uncharacterized protein n=1 Tax=Cedecea davisae DSM 4568 TaxID=566551 RepID=S3IYW9_9ENTR|nr:hypothetical protein HMPREF0201_04465 [Cedecea davisae DSM 4568]